MVIFDIITCNQIENIEIIDDIFKPKIEKTKSLSLISGI